MKDNQMNERKLLDGKVALVTGAGRGIGKAIALTYLKHGAKVVLGDVNQEWVDATVKEVQGDYEDSAIGLHIDITDPISVENAVKATITKFGELNILVNNAGVNQSHLFLNFPITDFDFVYKVNVRGTFLCSQTAARQMVKQGKGGCIINIASAAGKKADPGGTAYNSSKSAVIGLTRMIALELGQYNIRANCILPGATDTEMLRGVFEAQPDLKRILAERTTLQKMAKPEDQANAAVFLASELASHITGEQLVVSGGEFMET